MDALPRQLAGRLVGGVRLGCRVDSVGPGTVRLAGGGQLRAAAVVVATDPPTASELVPAIGPVAMRAVTTFYHRAPISPMGEALLLVDGEQDLIANTVVLTDAAPSYGPGDGALVATSVLGRAATAEPAVRRRLDALYGVRTADWDHLATYEVAGALPARPSPSPLRRPVRLTEGLYVCGDHRDTPSIQGALFSGRRVARAVLGDLGRPRPEPHPR